MYLLDLYRAVVLVEQNENARARTMQAKPSNSSAAAHLPSKQVHCLLLLAKNISSRSAT